MSENAAEGKQLLSEPILPTTKNIPVEQRESLKEGGFSDGRGGVLLNLTVMGVQSSDSSKLGS